MNSPNCVAMKTSSLARVTPLASFTSSISRTTSMDPAPAAKKSVSFSTELFKIPMPKPAVEKLRCLPINVGPGTWGGIKTADEVVNFLGGLVHIHSAHLWFVEEGV